MNAVFILDRRFSRYLNTGPIHIKIIFKSMLSKKDYHSCTSISVSVMSHVTHVYRSKEGTLPLVQEMQSDLVTEGILFPAQETHLSSSEHS